MASSDFDDQLDERFDPVFQRGHEGDPIAFAPHRSLARESPADVAPTAATDLSGNPWVVVLWLLAVLLSAGGLWMTWYAQVLFANPNVDNVVTYYVLPAVLESLAPIVTGVGLATLAGVVFLHAVRWRR
ncbi:hypothetical protein [Antiquaquibacter soli]|uniref:Uncharacterized protein n=1 Tax=Antiquaquibacter soli TaxID=3064523 RepID=A0ABT9BNS7_9MICO|nr:hypothetical protein [Protaetiibacter sp. WY-16]MDO7882692.1 hypothetical protein [Protaetiibacter sp. WY-16]